jgi:hypothetical protein
MFGKLQQLQQMVARLGLILALALLGLGHHAQLVHANTQSLAAYAMPDGTLPVLCDTAPQGQSGEDHAHCPACRLLAIPALAAIDAVLVWQMPQQAPPNRPSGQSRGQQIAAPPPEARAPPVLTV